MLFSDIRNIKNAGIAFNIPPNGRGISLYNNTGSIIALGDVILLEYEETADQEICAIIPVTTAFVRKFAVCIIEAVAIGAIGFFQTEGKVKAFCEGSSSIAKGDSLKLANSENEFKKDGSARAATSVAVALEAYSVATNALKSVWLIGEGATI